MPNRGRDDGLFLRKLLPGNGATASNVWDRCVIRRSEWRSARRRQRTWVRANHRIFDRTFALNRGPDLFLQTAVREQIAEADGHRDWVRGWPSRGFSRLRRRLWQLSFAAGAQPEQQERDPDQRQCNNPFHRLIRDPPPEKSFPVRIQPAYALAQSADRSRLGVCIRDLFSRH